MGLSINYLQGSSNIALFTNQLWLLMNKSMSALSSGWRINTAADGPAELVISEQLRAQIAGMSQQIENTNAQIYKYQTASSTLSEVRSQLTDLRTLAVGAANEGGNDEAAQAAYAGSADYLVEAINNTVAYAEYNGFALFDGSEGSLASLSPIEGVDLSSAEAASASMEVIDEAIASVDGAIVDVGATQANELESQVATYYTTRQNLIAAESQIRDTDYLMEYSNLISESIRLQASLAMMSQGWMSAETILNIFQSE